VNHLSAFSPSWNANQWTASLPRFVAALTELPLAFQPGATWRYSVAHDVLVYLVEILSDQALDACLRETLFEPLGMAA
jgi:CubicO group peptidase (beta-lactamase class C family)